MRDYTGDYYRGYERRYIYIYICIYRHVHIHNIAIDIGKSNGLTPMAFGKT